MQPTKATPLRVGVLGLGPLWRTHYRGALRGLRDLFHVAAVCDQAPARAAHTAKRLECAAAAGPTDLCGRADVEALLLLDAQWYGLWPLGLACRLGKPVFCCLPPQQDAEAAALLQPVEAARVPLLPALPLRAAPVTEELLRLFGTALGPPRRVVGVRGALGSPSVLELADWCSVLFGAPPLAVQRITGRAANCVELDHGEGRSAQLIDCPGLSPRLEVFTETGKAVVLPPRRLQWADGKGRYAHRLRDVDPGALMLRGFHRAVALRETTGPNLADVLRLQERLTS